VGVVRNRQPGNSTGFSGGRLRPVHASSCGMPDTSLYCINSVRCDLLVRLCLLSETIRSGEGAGNDVGSVTGTYDGTSYTCSVNLDTWFVDCSGN
jgi:hypothetical protein